MESNKLKNKKLLILGATPNDVAFVKRAQEMGVYVIVTDFNLDYSLSPAKYIADEVWDVSWSEVDTLVKLCKENNVDGVTAGYDEMKIDNLIEICNKLNLPCYATKEQLAVTRDKILFKNECRKCGVPTVKEYKTIDDVDEYPVIVKPVDRAGSIGITVAKNYKELVSAYNYAMNMSLKKKVIIEKFMDAQKVDIYYGIIDGNIEILTTNDSIMSGNNKSKVIQDMWLYPQKKEANLIKKEDKNLRNMIKDMNIQNGCIFFSAFIDKNDNYTFFECGFRLEGGNQYNYCYRKGKFNFYDVFIFHALLGTTSEIERNSFNGILKQATLNFYAKKGTICKIEGFDEVERIPQCTLSLVTAKEGKVCEDDKAILTKIGMFSIADVDSENIYKIAKQALSKIKVIDENGNSILYNNPDVNIIQHWWD